MLQTRPPQHHETGYTTETPADLQLRRGGDVFFVGGSLPVDETLTTMFDSFCQESTRLFHLNFGPAGATTNGMELARQIKRNFHARLMARLSGPVGSDTIASLYAAGIDLLDIPLPGNDKSDQALWSALQSAVAIFPRWAVASTLQGNAVTATATFDRIDALLAAGVVPLPYEGAGQDAAATNEYLAAAWERRQVPLTPFLPLIRLIAVDICPTPAGGMRGVIARLRDRQQLVAADLRRHLRVQAPTDSLDSAGL